MTKNTRKAVRAAALDGARAAAASPSVAMEPAAAQAVADRVAREVEPVLEHLTNAEPWYRSRVVIGNVIAIILAVMALVGLLSSGATEYEVLSVPVGIILANGFSLYGRLVAVRPLGQ